MKSSGSRVGIFGGAFDPVHIGHVQVVNSFLQSNLINRLMILPTAESPHKETSGQASFKDRFEMLKLAFDEEENVWISDLEQHLPKPSYTLQTIGYLQKNNPQHLYFLCIGEDNLDSFHKWWKYEQILDKVALIVAKRPGSEGSGQSDHILHHAIFIEHEEVELSSTDIREAKLSGDLRQYVPAGVAGYIHRHNLYSR